MLNAALGGDNNLAVVLSTYEPNIRCATARSFTHATSCDGLLAGMPASTARMVFGPDELPGVQEPLPQLIASGKLDFLDTYRYRDILVFFKSLLTE